MAHRLDRYTSGLLLGAKSASQSRWQRGKVHLRTYVGYFAAKYAFNARKALSAHIWSLDWEVKKHYLALCEGHFPKAWSSQGMRRALDSSTIACTHTPDDVLEVFQM